MEDHKVLTLDENKIMSEAQEATADLVSKAGLETGDLLKAGWPDSGPRWRKAISPGWYSSDDE